MKKTLIGKWITGVICAAFSVLVFYNTPITGLAYTQTVGIVSADAANVRKEPNTNSDTVTGLMKGSTVTITDEITDSAGSKWYQVSVDGNSGYIRSDLLIKGTASSGTTGNGNTTDGNLSAGTGSANQTPQATTAKKIAETAAYISYGGGTVRVREGASTKHGIAGSLNQNAKITLTGEAKDNEGNRWYEIKYTNANGNEVTGFVRADLVKTGEPPAAAPAPEETAPPAETETPEGEGDLTAEGEVTEPETEPEPEPAPEPETKPDYEMVYADNGEGQMEWYIYYNLDGTREKLSGLQAAAAAGAAGNEADKELMNTQKIIIIALAVVVALLVILITILLFKIKDLKADYEEDYDDDDDDEEEDEEEDDEEEEDEEEEEDDEDEVEVKPIRKFAKSKTKAPIRQMPEREQPVNKPVRKSAPEKETVEKESAKPAPRKAKNFLIDDDEFEFEFLNMDDKD